MGKSLYCGIGTPQYRNIKESSQSYDEMIDKIVELPKYEQNNVVYVFVKDRDINFEEKLMLLKKDRANTLNYKKFLHHCFKSWPMEKRLSNPYYMEAVNDLMNRTYGENYFHDDSGPYHLYALCLDGGKASLPDVLKEELYRRHKDYLLDYVQRGSHYDTARATCRFYGIFKKFMTEEELKETRELINKDIDFLGMEDLKKISMMQSLEEDIQNQIVGTVTMYCLSKK